MPIAANYTEVAPAGAVATNTHTAIADSVIDARPYSAVSYTITVATQSVDWEVFGANASDFSDEVSVLTKATVAAAAKSSYAVSPPLYAYYRVKIDASVDGVYGTATVRGIAKGS